MSVVYKHGNQLHVDHTPVSAVDAGDIVVINRQCYVATVDIEADDLQALCAPSGTTIFRLPKDDDSGPVFAAGDNVYWDASNGLATKVALGNTFFGPATAGAGASQAYVFAQHGGHEQPQVDTVASAGSTQTDATLLTGRVNTVNGADGTKGVKLPVGTAGDLVEVYNAVATNGLKIYPATGGALNGGTANAAITIEGKTHCLLRCIDGTNWAAIFTANT